MRRVVGGAGIVAVLAASCALDVSGLAGAGGGAGTTSAGGGSSSASASGPGGASGSTTSGSTASGPATTSSESASSSSGAGGGGPTFALRRQLTLDAGANVSINNIPILVVLDDTRIDYGQTQPTGQDLRFTTDTGKTVDHEIERWDPSGSSYVWIKVPSLVQNGASKTQLWMYYGSQDAEDAQNPKSLWTDYRGVWHLADPGDQLTDSSGNTASPAQNYGSTSSPGTIGDGRSFDKTQHQYIDTLNADQLSNFTIEAWVRGNNDPAGDNGPNGPLCREKNYELKWDQSTVSIGGADFKPQNQNWTTASFKTLTGGTWYYLAAIYDGSKLRVYKNGKPQNEATAATPEVETATAKIGRHAYNSDDTAFFDGDVDEVRISAQHHSDNWVSVQYLSMTDAMIAFGAEQTGSWMVP